MKKESTITKSTMKKDVDIENDVSCKEDEKYRLEQCDATRDNERVIDHDKNKTSTSLKSTIALIEKKEECNNDHSKTSISQSQGQKCDSIFNMSEKNLLFSNDTKLYKTSEFISNDTSISLPSSSSNLIGISNSNIQAQLSASAPSVPCSVSNLLSDILSMRNTAVKPLSAPTTNNVSSVISIHEPKKTESNFTDKNNADIILNTVLNQPWMQSHRLMFPNTLSSALNKISWRKGKWIDEEEVYTKKLIEAFNNGYLKIPTGTTLRSFLSEKLSCDPMRITKKFAGSSAIGKQVFTPCDPHVDPLVLESIHTELKDLGEKFNLKIDILQNNSMSNQAMAIAAALRANPPNIKQPSQFESRNHQEFKSHPKNKGLSLDSISNVNYNSFPFDASPHYYTESSLSSLYLGGDIKLSNESDIIKIKRSSSSLNLIGKQIKREKSQNGLHKLLRVENNSDGNSKSSSSPRMNTTSESSSSNGNYSSENSDENLSEQVYKTHPPKPSLSISSGYSQYPIINSSNGKALIFPHSHPKKKISAAASLAAAVASSCSSSKFDRDTSTDDSFYAVRHSQEVDSNNRENKVRSSPLYDNNDNTKKIKRSNSSTNLNNNSNNNHYKSNLYGNVVFSGFLQMQKNNSKEVENGNSIASFCNAAAHAYSNDQSRQSSSRFPMATNVEQVDLDASDLLLNFFNSSNYPKVETIKTNSLTASDSDLNEPSGRSSSSSSDRGTSAALSDIESTSSRNGEGNGHNDSKNNMHHISNVDNKKQKNDDITNIDHNNYYTLETLQQSGESIASNAIAANNSRKRFSYQMRDANTYEINDTKKIKIEETIVLSQTQHI